MVICVEVMIKRRMLPNFSLKGHINVVRLNNFCVAPSEFDDINKKGFYFMFT